MYITPDQLGEEAILLGLGASEPDTWAAGAPKGLAKSVTLDIIMFIIPNIKEYEDGWMGGSYL